MLIFAIFIIESAFLLQFWRTLSLLIGKMEHSRPRNALFDLHAYNPFESRGNVGRHDTENSYSDVGKDSFQLYSQYSSVQPAYGTTWSQDEEALRLYGNFGGYNYQPLPSAPNSVAASSGINYQVARPLQNEAGGHSYRNQKPCQHGLCAASGPMSSIQPSSESCHGFSEYSLYWTQVTNRPPTPLPHSTKVSPRNQADLPGRKYPQSDSFSPMMQSSGEIQGKPRAPGLNYEPDAIPSAWAPPKYPQIWRNPPHMALDPLKCQANSNVQAVPGPSRGCSENATASVSPKVPALEKSRSTSSHLRTNLHRSSRNVGSYQTWEIIRTPRPKSSKKGKRRTLSPSGRAHVKAVRQCPGGACEDCKRKKTKACVFNDAICL